LLFDPEFGQDGGPALVKVSGRFTWTTDATPDENLLVPLSGNGNSTEASDFILV
jgi:hypothetical protein